MLSFGFDATTGATIWATIALPSPVIAPEM